jgi:glycosyltransferase involved in cell wall biosynthesis
VLPDLGVRSLLLVRNGVDHDARVLRAARVAERTLGGRALVVGVATAAAPAGTSTVEGIAVLRLPPRPPGIECLTKWTAWRPQRWTARVSHAIAAAPPAGAKPAPTGAGWRSAAPIPAESHATRSHTTPSGRMRRILSGVSYSLQAIAFARRARAEVIQANDWNTMWAGLFIKYLSGARLVYDSHELWADRNGRWEWRPWLLACEALFVRVADEVLTSSPGYADALATRYRAPRPAVVRNIPEQAGAGDAADGRRPVLPLVVYIGGLMPGRGLEQMIDVLALLPAARLRAVGPGAPRYRASLLSLAQRAGVRDRFELCAPVPPAEVGKALAGAVAGLCLIQPICRSYELCLPNKLFEYTAAGVPVLASDLPVIGALVRRDGFGVLAPAEDPHAIAASLANLLEPDTWMLAAQRAHAFAETHSWVGEAHILADVYRHARARAA